MRRLTDPAQAAVDESAADALLCLSGSHPARRLPYSDRRVAAIVVSVLVWPSASHADMHHVREFNGV